MKFQGKVAFWKEDVEVKPGVYTNKVIEKSYRGELLSSTNRFIAGNGQNDTASINNRISILADLYMQENFSSIRYIEWKGVKLKVNSVVLEYPRVIMEIGGQWNGKTTS